MNIEHKMNEGGGPAFPCVGEGIWNSLYHAPGMTLRDYFAGQVLSGQWTLRESEAADIQTPTARSMAESAYRIADQMLAVRGLKNEGTKQP